MSGLDMSPRLAPDKVANRRLLYSEQASEFLVRDITQSVQSPDLKHRLIRKLGKVALFSVADDFGVLLIASDSYLRHAFRVQMCPTSFTRGRSALPGHVRAILGMGALPDVASSRSDDPVDFIEPLVVIPTAEASVASVTSKKFVWDRATGEIVSEPMRWRVRLLAILSDANGTISTRANPPSPEPASVRAREFLNVRPESLLERRVPGCKSTGDRTEPAPPSYLTRIGKKGRTAVTTGQRCLGRVERHRLLPQAVSRDGLFRATPSLHFTIFECPR
jgi:hypothetical protein